MSKPKPEKPLVIRCPNCKQTGEPDFNETTKRYVCPLCAAPVPAIKIGGQGCPGDYREEERGVEMDEKVKVKN